MNILPAPAGLHIVRAFRDAEGWNADVPVPVLALAIAPDLDVRYITPGEARPLESSLDSLSSRDLLRDLEWQDALVLATGEVLTTGDTIYRSVDSWIDTLRKHPYSNRTAASMYATPAPTKTVTKRRPEPVPA